MDRSNNTETEDETIALKKKRARRVSFADNEITSVHIFRRDDEDSESPHESTQPSSSADRRSPVNDVLGFFRDLGGDSDEEDLKETSPARNAGLDGDDDDGEAVDVRKSFLKPIGSPSPGGTRLWTMELGVGKGGGDPTKYHCTEDEFHGPVSASFIRPGQLSDSAASDDNHDLTMDSTAFSLHYRSLAWSDSGDLKTPTRFAVPFEEKTPSQTSGPTTRGSFMELTKVTKQSRQPSMHTDTASASRDSNDMSIVTNNPNRYDYDRLSPTIEAILAEGSKDSLAAAELDSDSSKQIKASVTKQNKNGVRSPSDFVMDDTAKYGISGKALSMAQSNLGEKNRCSMNSPVDGVANSLLSYKGDNTVADACINQIHTPDCSIKGIKEFVRDAIEPDKKQLDFVDANRKTPLEADVGYNLEVSTKHDIGYQSSNRGQVKEISLEDTGHVFENDHKFDQVYGNLIQGSTPLSVAGGERLFMGSADSSRHTGAITPPSKIPSSFLLEENMRNGETLSSIRKNIYKLRTRGTSSGASSLREGTEKLKSKLSKYSSGSTLFNRKDSESSHVGVPDAQLENHSVIPKNKGQQNLINMDDHGTNSLRNFDKLSQNEETEDSNMAGEPYNCMSADHSYNGNNLKSVERAVSPLQMLRFTTKMIDFDLADSIVEDIKDENTVSLHKNCVSSPIKLLNQTLSPSLDNQKNCFGMLKQLDQQNESVNCDLGHYNERCSPTLAKHLDMTFSGKDEKPSSAFEVAQVNQFPKAVSQRESAESPANKVLVVSTYREGIQSPIQEASIPLPSMQEPSGESVHHNVQSLSSKGNSGGPADNDYHKALQVAQSPFSVTNMEIHSGKKRKGTELLSKGGNKDEVERIGKKQKGATLLSEGDNRDEIERIDNFPNVRRSCYTDLQIILGQSDDVRHEREKPIDQTGKNYADILEEFSGSTKQLLCPSADKLNLTMIGRLEDVLVHLQRVKKIECLCSEILSQRKVTDPVSTHRVKEIRMLLYNIVYEKAKRQLMDMKRERLQKKVQQLRSGLQESQMWKLNCISRSSKIVAIETPSKSHIYSGQINNEGKHQVTCNKMRAMMQELETLLCEAKSLNKFLHSCCKLEGDQSCSDTITLVNYYLKKKMSYKCIVQNLQMWEIDNFEHKDGCYKVLLNYCGYIIQRFIVNTGSRSIVISNKLNDQNIVKTFPGMDALAAFIFVLNPNTTKKCTGSRCLAQETQVLTPAELADGTPAVGSVGFLHRKPRRSENRDFLLFAQTLSVSRFWWLEASEGALDGASGHSRRSCTSVLGASLATVAGVDSVAL
ncbi:uncharacterized protein G2W53_018351 [Senna tora]|uniref:Knl1 C-terminal RWD domain-containing protein n=1 Tax=Senna tora TaxID=362788 RepID=A0A834TTH0_9FABA|nr:uncharacterized protein G2W53_018351 [Senna tora]